MSYYGFTATHWPADATAVTQDWGANPQNYARFNLPGHDGIDIAAPTGAPIYAIGPGTVYRVERDADAHNYGIHVRIQHAGGVQSIYAHFEEALVAVGDEVIGGQVIGLADSTGNSSGAHLHLSMKVQYQVWRDRHGVWPYALHNPWLWLGEVWETAVRAAVQ